MPRNPIPGSRPKATPAPAPEAPKRPVKPVKPEEAVAPATTPEAPVSGDDEN